MSSDNFCSNEEFYEFSLTEISSEINKTFSACNLNNKVFIDVTL